jgi:hypothetical protein
MDTRYVEVLHVKAEAVQALAGKHGARRLAMI